LLGTLARHEHSPVKVSKNLDVRTTIRRNLRHFDPERRQLFVERVFFWNRTYRRKEWHVIVCVDESGSMVDSVIHAAIMGGIFTSLRSVRTSFVVFDTGVVDLSDIATDPVEVLLSVQLGGGTDIGKAVTYCESLITSPDRTLLILLSDFFEGAPEERLIAAIMRMRESGVRMIGLAALDFRGDPVFNRELSQTLSEHGLKVAALTPRQLAERVIDVMDGQG
jgi:Mg-chelatase subunit ChlD